MRNDLLLGAPAGDDDDDRGNNPSRGCGVGDVRLLRKWSRDICVVQDSFFLAPDDGSYQ